MGKHPKHKIRKISKKEELIPPITEKDVKIIGRPGVKEAPPLEDQLQELKKDYYLVKGKMDSVVDVMLAKVIAVTISQNQILVMQQKTIEDFKKLVPKEKWPKTENPKQ